MSVNKVQLIGRIGQAPEVKQINEHLKVFKTSLATTEKFTDKGGVKQEKTEWHNLTGFNQVATLFEQYVNKGDLIYIEGKLQTRSWEKDGVKHYSTEVLVNTIDFLQPKSTTSIADQPNGIDDPFQ